MDRQWFLQGACERLEKGHHSYTLLDEKGGLSHCAWLVERCEEALPADLPQGFTPPEACALIVVSERDLMSSNPDRTASLLQQMVADAGSKAKAKAIYLSLRSSDAGVVAVAERLGFIPEDLPAADDGTRGRDASKAPAPVAEES